MAKRQGQTAQVRYVAVDLESSRFLFRPEKEHIFRPRRGSTIEHAWKIGRLDYVQQRAWTLFIRMVMDAAGVSGPVTSAYSEMIDITGQGAFNAPTAYSNEPLVLFEYLMDRHLSRKERALLKDLLYDELTRPGIVGLDRIGFIFAGYKDDAQARASGIGVILCLLDRLDEFFKHHAHVERFERAERAQSAMLKPVGKNAKKTLVKA